MKSDKAMVGIGWGMTLLAALPFIMSFAMKFAGGPQVIEGMGHLGWPVAMLFRLAVLEAACVLLYLLPPTAVLGAILLTGYLGGAIATHTRLGEPVHLHIAIGLLIWGGLYLREARLRDLLPIRAGTFLYEREILIDRPVETVFAHLKLLRNFESWNPFLKKGTLNKLEYRGMDGQIGSIAIWDGDRNIGAGEQEITRIIEGQRVDFELRFLKPFKATNTGYFYAESIDGMTTRVKWGMAGKSGFPMNLIGLFINCEKMIASDFERGLSELKALLERK